MDHCYFHNSGSDDNWSMHIVRPYLAHKPNSIMEELAGRPDGRGAGRGRDPRVSPPAALRGFLRFRTNRVCGAFRTHSPHTSPDRGSTQFSYNNNQLFLFVHHYVF